MILFINFFNPIMKKKNININELSKITGFSVATVSRALNGLISGNMKKETYEKIIKVADSYGYIPNQLSIGLRRGFIKIAGIIFPSIINPYYAMLGNLIEEKAFLNSYLTYVCNSNYDPKRELAYIKMLKAQMVAGIFLCSTGLSRSILEELDSDRNPIILLDEEVKNYHGASVTIDDIKGGYLGTEFLIKNNHKNIAFMTGPRNINSSKERLKGVLEALKDNGIKIKENYIFCGDYSIESGKKIAEEICLKHKEISAIFCFNDLMAIGAYTSIRKLNIEIPDKISILGYDNNMFSEIVSPSISTVATPVELIADIAFKMILLSKGKNNKITNKKFIVTPYLIERESTIKK